MGFGFSTSSGPLATLFKLLTTFLLVNLLVGQNAAHPLRSAPRALAPRASGRDSFGRPNGKQILPPSLAPRSLVKRSNCQPWPENENFYKCDGEVPGVDEAVEKMAEYGVVGSIPSVFYTNMPGGLARAQSWASCFFTGEPESPSRDQWLYTVWKRITDNKWLASESFWVFESMDDEVLTEDDQKYYKDLVLKHTSQAYAELSKGDVYLVVEDATTPDDRSWNTDQAWGGKSIRRSSWLFSLLTLRAGWEWPALTRNSGVERILRVDPSTGEEPRVIWTKADGQQGGDPKVSASVKNNCPSV